MQGNAHYCEREFGARISFTDRDCREFPELEDLAFDILSQVVLENRGNGWVGNLQWEMERNIPMRSRYMYVTSEYWDPS